MENRVSILQAAGFKHKGLENGKRKWAEGNWETAKTNLLANGYTEQAGKAVKDNAKRTVTVSFDGSFLFVEVIKK